MYFYGRSQYEYIKTSRTGTPAQARRGDDAGAGAAVEGHGEGPGPLGEGDRDRLALGRGARAHRERAEEGNIASRSEEMPRMLSAAAEEAIKYYQSGLVEFMENDEILPAEFDP